MSGLTIVSNRLPAVEKRKTVSGGLVVTLNSPETHGAKWVGWSGKLAKPNGAPPRVIELPSFVLHPLDLSEEDYKGYYLGFSNQVLWPVLHYRPGLLRFERTDYEAYLRVNERFAAAGLAASGPKDVIWVHDYHLIPVAAALRRMNWRGPIGLFLHTPVPSRSALALLPCWAEIRDMPSAYDVIGVQTPQDARHLKDFLRTGANDAGTKLTPEILSCPAGIDVEAFQADASKSGHSDLARRLIDSLGDRALMIGAERMDYSKGLPERCDAYARLLAARPEHIRRVSFLQIASRTREDIPDYRSLKHDIDRIVGEINGRLGDFDWTPVRYVTRPVARRDLAKLFRMARIGIVTPLRDGMNLVAKEYVAAQDADAPGILILSEFAGAAAALSGALIVNPYDKDAIVGAMHQALIMPDDERVARHRLNIAAVRRDSASRFARTFLFALRSAGARHAA